MSDDCLSFSTFRIPSGTPSVPRLQVSVPQGACASAPELEADRHFNPLRDAVGAVGRRRRLTRGISPWSSSRSSISIGSISLELCTCARCFSATTAIGVEAGLHRRRRALLSSAARRYHGLPPSWRNVSCRRTTPVQSMTASLRIPSVPGPSPAPAATPVLARAGARFGPFVRSPMGWYGSKRRRHIRRGGTKFCPQSIAKLVIELGWPKSDHVRNLHFYSPPKAKTCRRRLRGRVFPREQKSANPLNEVRNADGS